MIALVLALSAVEFLFADAAFGDKPEIDPTWAAEVQFNMIGPHLIVDAQDKQPNLYAYSEGLYLVVFQQTTIPDPATSGPITVGNGHHPQVQPVLPPGTAGNTNILPESVRRPRRDRDCQGAHLPDRFE